MERSVWRKTCSSTAMTQKHRVFWHTKHFLEHDVHGPGIHTEEGIA